MFGDSARNSSWGFLLGGTILLLLAIPTASSAQVLYGSLVGNVKDTTGAVIPGATVTVTHKETNQTRQSVSNPSGGYSFPSIAAGIYVVRVTKEGFKSYTSAERQVTINTVTRVDVTLEVGAVAETVTVTAEAPALQTDRSEVRAEIGSKTLENLPVPLGRNYQNLFRVLPGFRPPSNAHSVPTNPSRALTFNVNGVSQSVNNTRIDGASNNAPWLPHITSFIPTLDAIDTVNIVTNSFDAEQGLAGGAAINVSIKSGTNNIHGSFFEYHTNNVLKAKPWILPQGLQKPKFVWNEFGGTLGGPIKRDKLFYFISYEGSYDREFASRLETVATPEMRRGDMSDSTLPVYDPLTGNADGSNRSPFPGNIIPSARLHSISKKIQDLTPLPNLSGISRNFFGAGGYLFDRHRADTKVNWVASTKLSVFGRFSILHYAMFNPEIFGGGNGPYASGAGGNSGTGYGNTPSFTGAATYTITPRLIMDAYFGYTRADTNIEQSQLDQKVGLDILGIPGTNGSRRFEGGWPAFIISNFTRLGMNNNFQPYYRRDPQYQIVSNFGWTRNTHEVRFGFDIYGSGMNHLQPENPSSAGPASGGFSFGTGPTLTTGARSNQYHSYGTFLLGLPTQIGRILQVPDEYNTRAWAYSLYIRDRWNVTRRLTFSYGTRWEYFPFPGRVDSGFERYDPINNKMLVCGVGQVPRDCGVSESMKRFAPRIGLAYRATDSFVIRAGYGITNDPYSLQRDFRTNYPMLVNLVIPSPTSLLWAGRLEEGIPPLKAPDLGNGVIDIPGNVVAVTVPDRVNRGYVQSWNFTLQKQLPLDLTGQVGYVATRSTRQMGRIDLNAGQIIGAGQAGRPLRQKFGRTAETILVTPLGTTHYNALQATLERRFSKGLQLGMAYTWSKVIGFAPNSDSGVDVDALQFFARNRTVLGYDRTHMFHISNIWELPFGRGKRWISGGGVATAILGGWQVNHLLSMYTGEPFTISSSGTSLDLPGSAQTADQVKPRVEKFGNAGRGMLYFDTSAFAQVTEPRFGTAAMRSMRGPGLVNWDFGVFRQFQLTERWKLEFRMESFNFTNTPHFSNPNGSVTSSDFGTITGVRNLGRDGIDERQFRFGLRISF